MKLSDGSVFLLVDGQRKPVAASADLEALRAAGNLLGTELVFSLNPNRCNVLREFDFASGAFRVCVPFST